jgi:hypothetical protein
MTPPAKICVLLVLAASLMGGTGCQALGYAFTKLVGPWLPDEETEAQYSLKDKSVLILVYTKDPSLASEHPRLQSALADAVGKVLVEQHACGPVVPSRSVEIARRSQPNFNERPVEEIGREFNVDLVLHIEVFQFNLSDIGASNMFEGYAEAGVRIVNPQTGEQVWPVLTAAKLISGKTTPAVDASQPASQETILVEGYGEKLARLFYTYKKDDLPLRRNVE